MKYQARIISALLTQNAVAESPTLGKLTGLITFNNPGKKQDYLCSPHYSLVVKALVYTSQVTDFQSYAWQHNTFSYN